MPFCRRARSFYKRVLLLSFCSIVLPRFVVVVVVCVRQVHQGRRRAGGELEREHPTQDPGHRNHQVTTTKAKEEELTEQGIGNKRSRTELELERNDPTEEPRHTQYQETIFEETDHENKNQNVVEGFFIVFFLNYPLVDG